MTDMSTFTYITDPKLLPKHIGRGTVALLSDECVAFMAPCRYNGALGISFSLSSVDVHDVREGMPKAEMRKLMEDAERDTGDHNSLILAGAHDQVGSPETGPPHPRNVAAAWQGASRVLRQLALMAIAEANRNMGLVEDWVPATKKGRKL
jgi:hypothetical protein